MDFDDNSDFEGGDIGEGDFEPCDRFIFFDGCCSGVGVVEGGERVAAAREA